MRFYNPLDDLFRTRTRLKILRLLTRHPDVPFTGREIARNLGLAHSNVAAELVRLKDFGVIRSLAKGPSYLYQINSQHIMVPDLWGLFSRERNLLNFLLDQLPKKWKARLRSVLVFGSVARGLETPTSDVDLCLVARNQACRKWLEAELENFQAEFFRRTGNRFSPFLLSASSFAERYRKSDPLIRQIAREGKMVMGETIGELLA